MLDHLYPLALAFMAGICVYSAIQHCTNEQRWPERRVHLLFAALALLMSLAALTNTLVFQATTVADYVAVLRVNIAIILLSYAVMPWFFAEYSRVRTMTMQAALSGAFVLLFLVNLTRPYTLLFKDVHGLGSLALPWGERVTLPQVAHSAWGGLAVVVILANSVFAFYTLIALFRRERRRTALIMMFALGLFVVAYIEGALTRMGIVHFVPLGPFGVLGMVVIMGMTLNYEMRAERKRIENELQRSQADLAAVFESTDDFIWSVDVNYRVMAFNGAIAKYLRQHYGTEARTGVPVDELIPPDRASHWPVLFARAIDEGPYRTEYILTDGRIVELSLNSIVHGSEVVGVSVFGKDITERNRTQEMLLESEKMRTVAGLAAGMAHEINNPLTGVICNTQVMADRLTIDCPATLKAAEAHGLNPARLQQFLEKREIPEILDSIRVAGDRAAEVVRNMLQFSRRDETDLSSMKLCDLIEQTLSLARTDNELQTGLARVQVIKQYDPEAPEAPCHPQQMQQVILNLLRNAVQAMQGNPLERPAILTIRTGRRGQGIVLEIEDNGPGIPPEVRQRIFEPFYTTKPVGQGTGLGLFLCYHIIIYNHKGTLTVDSVSGSSTRFTIVLPRVAEKGHEDANPNLG